MEPPHFRGMSFYKRCPACRGTGLRDGDECEACEGCGGFWVVVDGHGGLSVEVIPGDADDRPDGVDGTKGGD